MLKFLSSLKLAVMLIAAIAAMSVLATIYPEADAFNSWSFRILVIAFFINLGLCTVKLLPGLWKQLHRSAADVPENGAYRTYAADEADVIAWLRENHYQFSRSETTDGVKILASKGKLGLCAPHLLHISLLVILAGALCSTFNTQGYVMGQIGQNRPFPEALRAAYGDNSSVEILNFETAYDEEQAVDNWITQFNLYVDGQLVAEQVKTMVNHPYRYGNLLIYQNSYDYRYLLEVQGSADADDNTTYGLPDNQPSEIAGQTVVAAKVNDKVYVQISDHVNPARGQFVEPGDVLTLNEAGATITYLDTAAYSILELKIRNGTYIVFAGFLLATLASFLFFSGRYRELRIRINKNGKNSAKESDIWCYSKNTVVVEELQTALAEQWAEKQQEVH